MWEWNKNKIMCFFGKLSSGLLASDPRLLGRENSLGSILFFCILNRLGVRLVDYNTVSLPYCK